MRMSLAAMLCTFATRLLNPCTSSARCHQNNEQASTTHFGLPPNNRLPPLPPTHSLSNPASRASRTERLPFRGGKHTRHLPTPCMADNTSAAPSERDQRVRPNMARFRSFPVVLRKRTTGAITHAKRLSSCRSDDITSPLGEAGRSF